MPGRISSGPSASAPVTEEPRGREISEMLPALSLRSFSYQPLQMRRGGSELGMYRLGAPKFQTNVTGSAEGFQQASSLGASLVFGFEQGMLYGEILKELIR